MEVRVGLQPVEERGDQPERLVLDNSPECASKALDQWAYERGVELSVIRPRKPIENCFVESSTASFATSA